MCLLVITLAFQITRMFILSRMVDTVKIPPNRFDADFHKALIFELNKKFANKVVLNVGLCICFFDFEKIEDSYILPGDGSSHTKVHFRYTVFRPFVDEILSGTIRSCSREGISASMGFFDDVVIPADKLPHPSRFQESEQLWVWQYDTGEEGAAPVDLYMEPNSEIRFRVAEERFTETQPSAAPQTQHSDESAEDKDKKQPPYLIIGTMSESGLGCLQWWTNNDG